MNKIIKRTVESPEENSLSDLRKLNAKLNHSDLSEELVHYGVLGMKWGVRRYQNADGSLTPRGRARQTRQEDARQQTERAKSYRDRRTLSDEQLKRTVQRLEAEKKLRSLVREDIMPAHDWVSNHLLKFGSSALGAAAGVIGAALAKEYLKKHGFPIGKD